MKKWVAILILLAVLDVLTTYISLPLGSIEANPLFRDMGIGTMALIKMGAYIVTAGFGAYFKLRGFLIFCIGVNAGAVLNNVMIIWTLKTM